MNPTANANIGIAPMALPIESRERPQNGQAIRMPTRNGSTIATTIQYQFMVSAIGHPRVRRYHPSREIQPVLAAPLSDGTRDAVGGVISILAKSGDAGAIEALAHELRHDPIDV